jgi:hypothetical protein
MNNSGVATINWLPKFELVKPFISLVYLLVVVQTATAGDNAVADKELAQLVAL